MVEQTDTEIRELTGRRLSQWTDWLGLSEYDAKNPSHKGTSNAVKELQTAYDSKDASSMRFYVGQVSQGFSVIPKTNRAGSDTELCSRVMGRTSDAPEIVRNSNSALRAHMISIWTLIATQYPEILYFFKQGASKRVGTFGMDDENITAFAKKMAQSAVNLQSTSWSVFSNGKITEPGVYYTQGKKSNGEDIKTLTVNGLEILDLAYTPKPEKVTEGGDT